MKYIKTFESHRRSSKDEMINEEFVGKLIKGALSKLFQTFTAPFKDLANDIKNAFKDDDPNSIKGIVLTNLNQGIDNAQKLIRDKAIQAPGDVTNIMTQFITTLTDLANEIGKDFNNAIENKSKASGANEVAKAILLGSKEAQWKGIIGLLSDPNYKYSKAKYEQSITTSTQKKNGPDALKAAQNTAITFFDNFQKDITTQINNELTEEEMKKIYEDAVKRGGGVVAKYDYKQLKEFYDKKTPVRYKREGYDDSKKPEEQEDKIGKKIMNGLDDQGGVTFLDKDDQPTIKKKYADILGPEEKKDTTAEEDNLKKDLGEIKTKNPEKLADIGSVVGIFKDDSKKDAQEKIKDIVKGEAPAPEA